MPAALPPGGAHEVDALIVGAGPAGLYQVFTLGLLGIAAHVVDALPHPGGQCAELYASKPIYDLPALPATTGRELVAALLRQIAPFNAAFHFSQLVTTVQPQKDGRFHVSTSHGTRFIARTLFIAAGAGAFLPRTLKVPGIERFTGTQVFYSLEDLPDPTALTGQRLIIVGGEDAALQAAAHYAGDAPPAQQAAHVTLLHRRDVFEATPALLQRVQALRQAGRLHFVAGQPIGIDAHADTLTALRILDAQGQERALPLTRLLVRLGLAPTLGLIAKWNLALERKQLKVNAERLVTSTPGIFAIGDAVTYPGKKKLLLSAFHEATQSAFAAATWLHPEAPPLVQYTTTSRQLRARLGIVPDNGA